MKRKSTRQAGNALVVIMFVVVLVTGLMFIFLQQTTAGFKSQRFQRDSLQALWQANAQMQLAMNMINTSTYDANGQNQVLLQNANTGIPISGTNVTLTLIAGSNGWYEMRATATVGSATKIIRQLVRGRDTFSRFGIFTGNNPVGLGDLTVGDVHTNRWLEIYFPNATFNGNVSAVQGFRWYLGAAPGNTHFMGLVSPSASVITMPTIQNMQSYASGVYYQSSTNNVQITLLGNRVQITVTGGSSGNYALPADGVIYVKGNVTQLSGTLNGRLTIVSEQAINITGTVMYIDGNSNSAYLNGDRSNQPFVPNPQYTGNSSLGLAANGHINITSSVPNYVEIDAVMYSKTGHIGMAGYTMNADGTALTSYDSSFHKSGVRYLGSMTSYLRPVDQIVNGSGTVISGFTTSLFTYDSASFLEPPPYFLTFARPQYSGWEVLQ